MGGGSTGGSATHSHTYGIQLGNYYGSTIFEFDEKAGVLANGTGDPVAFSSSVTGVSCKANSSTTTTTTAVTATHYKSTASTSATSTLPPYLALYVWKRTA